MLIDWFTIVAQLINFAILVVALKYLLYDRIVEKMEERRSAIAGREERARSLTEEATEETQRLEEQRRELDRSRDDILDEARREADELHRQLLAEARQDVEGQELEWRQSVRSRRERLLAELQRITGEKAIAISRRVLRDLADAGMEQEVVRRFLDRVSDVPDGERKEMVEALRADGSPLLVRTAFEISDEGWEPIRKGLRELIGDPDREIEWEQDPELIGGIVIAAGARTVGWTMDTYLDGLERAFDELIHEHVGADAEHAPPVDEAGNV